MAIDRRRANAGLLAAALAARPRLARAAEPQSVVLPPPRTEGGLPLMQALARRRSGRAYADRTLRPQTLSDLLWAAFGVNRPDGGRTAPSWHGLMVTDLYVAAADGTWLYDPKRHRLLARGSADLRSHTGTQDFAGRAALNLVYVAHGERMTELDPAERRAMAAADAGVIGQNVYLFCASEGLATVLRAAVDGTALARRLALPASQFVTFAQSVGYPGRG